MASYNTEQRRTGLRSWSRGRWILIAVVAVAIVAAILLITYMGEARAAEPEAATDYAGSVARVPDTGGASDACCVRKGAGPLAAGWKLQRHRADRPTRPTVGCSVSR